MQVNRLAVIFTSLLLLLMCLGNNGGTSSAAENPVIVVDPFLNGPGSDDPEEIFDQCVNRWLGNQTKEIPYTWYDYNCDQVVGYHFEFRYFDNEGVEQILDDYMGEESDGRASMGLYSWPPPTPPPYQFDYEFKVEGYTRCVDPDFKIEPEKSGLNVGEQTRIVANLFCNETGMVSQTPLDTIIFKITGPGSLSDEKVQFENGEAFTTYTATEPGLATIEASYLTCSITGNRERSWWVYATTKVGVGDCVAIDIEYHTADDRFDEDQLRWGGSAHIDICLDTIDEQVEGYTVPLLRGTATGTQTCWVKDDDPTTTIEDIKCDDFVATVNSGSALGGYFGFSVDIDARLKFVIVEDRGEGAVYRWDHDENGLSEVPILISLPADRESEYVLEDETVLGSPYKITARWI
jgi:hypothetical protein